MTLISEALAQAQPNTSSGSLSPESLRALSDLIRAAGHEWWSEASTALTAVVSVLAWPIVVVFSLYIFREPIKGLIGRIREIELPGALGKVKAIDQKLNQSAEEASKREGESDAPTPGELKRAIEVERLTGELDISVVRKHVDELAAEYERVRTSMSPGDPRTRAMEVVMSKMRTFGRAAYPLRYELAASPSPGRRLQAIACLQVIPDYDELDWLAERVDKERPFVGYHALVALNTAARGDHASAHLKELKNALGKVKEKSKSLGKDADRSKAIGELERAIQSLTEPTSTPGGEV